MVVAARGQAPSAPESIPAAVLISRDASHALHVVMETDVLRLEYGPDVKPREATVFKVLSLVHKPSGQKIGPFDSRYSPSRTEFLTLREAEQIRTRSPDEIAVRLYFLTRILDITLTRGSAVVRFDYTFLNDSKHTYDQVNVPGAAEAEYFWSGREAYARHMGWAVVHQKGEPDYAPYPLSFFRHDWAGGKYLDHKGWLIIGAGAPGQLGYGAILPLAQLQWLKLMARTGGLERMMTGNATVYYYVVPGFSREKALLAGEAFVDALK